MVYTCTNCNKKFKANREKNGNKFCDKQCLLEYRKKQRQVNCLNCGKLFEKKKNIPFRTAKFCSEWCRNEYNKYSSKCKWCGKKIEDGKIFCCENCKNTYKKYYIEDVNCHWCGVKIENKKNSHKDSKNRFCSIEHFKAYQLSKTHYLKCGYCGNEIKRTTGQINNTNNRKPRKHFFCNKECFSKWQEENRVIREKNYICPKCGEKKTVKSNLCGKCAKQFQKIILTCNVCGKEVSKPFADGKRRNKETFCCSKECSNIKRSKKEYNSFKKKNIIGIYNNEEFEFNSVTEAANYIGKSLSTITTRCISGIQGPDGWSFKRKEE